MNDRADIKRTASTNNSQPARSDGRLCESDVSNRSKADYFKPISDMQMPKAVVLRPPKRRPIAYQPTFWYGLMMLVLAYLGLMSLRTITCSAMRCMIRLHLWPCRGGRVVFRL